MSTQSATITLTRAVSVAEGEFAPGHLGALTSYLPFELVDDVLEQTRTVQRRLRVLPSRVGVYFVLALGLFPRLGYARVWGKLTAGLAGLGLPRPSEKALRDLRRRLGPAPLKALFEVVAGPLAQPRTPGVSFAGLRTVAFDGLNSLQVPDTSRNRSWIGRIRYRMGFAGYPTLRLMALAETGTRGLLGATLGSASDRDEANLARRLLPLLGPGVLVLLDRAFDANAFLAEVAATGAMLLARAKSTRNPRVLAHLPDGSYLSCLDGLAVRIIEADVVMTGADGSRAGDRYRLITTLTDHRRYPALALVRLYHERWEIETAYLALRHTLLNGHVLRSGDQPGLEQETWALLTLCQLLRMAMVEAIETRPGANPDRASFTTALEAARDQITAAAGDLPRRPARPARRARPRGPGHLATRPPGPLQRPHGQMHHCPLPRPRPQPPLILGRHHRDRHHHAHPAAGHRRARPQPLQARHTPATRPADPTAAHHRPHELRALPALDRQGTRRPPPGQAPQHAHPARRVGPARLPHPHRLRHLRPQHAATTRILDNRTGPLTTRHCRGKWPPATLDIEPPEALWPETKGQAASLARIRGHPLHGAGGHRANFRGQPGKGVPSGGRQQR
jgi:hypothetical protein